MVDFERVSGEIATCHTQVRIEKINVEVMGRWVSERLAELLGFEDDVLSDLVMNMRVLGVPLMPIHEDGGAAAP